MDVQPRVVCVCAHVLQSDLEIACESESLDAEELASRTGASTRCGACFSRLAAFTGVPGGHAACIVERRWVTPDMVGLTLAPAIAGEAFPGFSPGQFLILSVEGPRGWVSRPYTIVSSATDDRHRDVMVRILPNGRMGALLSADDLPAQVRVGSPRGDGLRNLMRTRRGSVFLVGGVGVTPAIAALRAFADTGRPRVKLVFASLARESTGAETLLQALGHRSDTQVEIWNSDQQGFVSRAEIGRLVEEHGSVDWFVCGPPGFQQAVVGYLHREKVPASRVHEEVFSPSLDHQGLPPPRHRSSFDSVWTTVGVVSTLLWCAQYLLAPRLPLLETLLGSTPWKVGTGLALLLAVGAQWLLFAVRAAGEQGRARLFARAHQIVGALSPLLLLLHTRSIGHGVLALLTALFLANVGLGLAPPSLVRDPARRIMWMRVWLPAHITTAVVTTVLMLWHLYLVVAFRGGWP